ncbi:hypothetical protein BDF19DRAFT_278079 [Syncephalis fuscata]|nr:hypothetical protein BDF19DRAFT_278079 [Syncephalis fuscata]
MSSRPVSYVRNSRRRWRWPVVALTCISLASSYYVYDLPAALNRPLRSQLNIAHDEWQYWLAGSYATYALPNVFMPFYVPHLMNKLGPRYLFILLALLALIGQLCFTTALLPSTTTTTTTKHNSLLLLLGGRFLLGLGVESLGVAQSSLTCQWFFSSRRLGLALSLNVVMARMGAILNDITSPWIWHQWDSPDHTWMNQLWSWLTRCGIPENWLTGAIMANIIGLVMCMAGLITACIVVFMDYWSEQRYTRNPEISF